KTARARRDVVLMPALGRLLSEHRLRSRFSLDDDYVFANTAGGPTHPDVLREGAFRPAVRRAELDRSGGPRLRLHDLRHTYASILVAQGANIAFVSRQLGHTSPATTLGVYTHLFDHNEHAQQTRDTLEHRFGQVLDRVASTSTANITPGQIVTMRHHPAQVTIAREEA